MLVLKCDRASCGKFYEPYGGTEVRNSVIIACKYFSGNTVNSKSFDLCPECMQEFQKFLGMKIDGDETSADKDPT